MADPDKTIPTEGEDKEALLSRMEEMRAGDADWRGAHLWSLVFHHSDEHTEFLKRAHGLFFDENALNPMAFRSLKAFEADVVRMASHLLGGGRTAVGTMTSGGTESIMLAVRTCRDRARALKPWITAPKMIIPESAHVAFIKAGKYFDVEMVLAPLGADGRVDTAAVERLVTPDTIALAGSAPCYPLGVVDPIPALGQIALRHDLGLHVDACVGGFFLPFLAMIQPGVPSFDFSVPGVTSISADLHKYGYSAKGASVILYRDMSWLKHQFFVYVDWMGGVFASPSMPGTRPGGIIAAAWAGLHAMGVEGYKANAARVMKTTRDLIAGIESIPELGLAARPDMCILAYMSRSDEVNIFSVGDFLESRGWTVDRQSRPASIHLSVNPLHAGIADRYIADLRDAVAHVKAHPDTVLSGSAPAYGLMINAPVRSLVRGNVLQAMMKMYSPDGTMPDLGGGAEPGESGEPRRSGSGVPAPVMWLMKLRYHLGRLFK